MTTTYPFLLTIAVPTYNRASYLDLCLSQICSQLKGHEGMVELLVSDNCSTDSTGDVVRKYISLGYPLRYLRNAENIGPDRNFLQCFQKAQGKYFLLFGDDDVLLSGFVGRICKLLRAQEYGVVYINSYPFLTDYEKERSKHFMSGQVIYDDVQNFIKRVHYFFAFVSGNIVNRHLVPADLDLEAFLGSNLVQLGWTFGALFNSTRNLSVEECLFATRLSDARNYRLTQVFGSNFEKVCEIFIRRGIERSNFEIIRKKLVSAYLPAHIIRQRKGMIDLQTEDYYKVLYPAYHKCPAFWLLIVPAIFLPVNLAHFLFSSVKLARAAIWFTRSFFRRR